MFGGGFWVLAFLLAFALVGKNIVFRFIIEYSSLREFDPYVGSRSILI